MWSLGVAAPLAAPASFGMLGTFGAIISHAWQAAKRTALPAILESATAYLKTETRPKACRHKTGTGQLGDLAKLMSPYREIDQAITAACPAERTGIARPASRDGRWHGNCFVGCRHFPVR
jgi:hypothetical protein